ncbi:MAG: hypothetical protein BGP10_08980 [Rhodanobacter sp. 68-29]|nr:hypothetical protein [Rhodanobacter sp.]ODU73678.1 MAG: hypothetical protein ABT17_11230 [Rhodanobacter sp. SCN 69-32]OJY59044.1 MAG: hypothetical protein BGP10_08980 [Rhodanobacter sp. 68-29]
MNSLLTLVSTLVWWVLYGSIGALFCALIAWSVLRWTERCNVVFNRVYLACLLWTLLGMLLVAGVAAYEGHLHPPFRPLLTSSLLRLALVMDMVAGVALVWRLTPRVDAHRVRVGSACLAVAAVMAVGFGVATSLV